MQETMTTNTLTGLERQGARSDWDSCSWWPSLHHPISLWLCIWAKQVQEPLPSTSVLPSALLPFLCFQLRQQLQHSMKVALQPGGQGGKCPLLAKRSFEFLMALLQHCSHPLCRSDHVPVARAPAENPLCKVLVSIGKVVGATLSASPAAPPREPSAARPHRYAFKGTTEASQKTNTFEKMMLCSWIFH